jgi:hypothetical protein
MISTLNVPEWPLLNLELRRVNVVATYQEHEDLLD